MKKMTVKRLSIETVLDGELFKTMFFEPVKYHFNPWSPVEVHSKFTKTDLSLIQDGLFIPLEFRQGILYNRGSSIMLYYKHYLAFKRGSNSIPVNVVTRNAISKAYDYLPSVTIEVIRCEFVDPVHSEPYIDYTDESSQLKDAILLETMTENRLKHDLLSGNKRGRKGILISNNLAYKIEYYAT